MLLRSSDGHSYLSADIAADLVRDAAATCCSRIARQPVADRIRTTVQRVAAELHRTTPRTTPACSPA